MTIEAPAKVNLVLRILGRRTDGFHALETLMVPLTLSDSVSVAVAGGEGVVLSCDDPAVPADATNLAWRAAEAFAAATGLKFHATIALTKRIPSGAGLAGGSSNAATVLRALDRLLGTRLPAAELEEIAARLGSDVPFFIRRQTSWCRGRGEIIEPASPLPARDLLLAKPPFPVPTVWAYSAWAAAPWYPAVPVDVDGLSLVNDLEAPVFSKYLLLPALKTWLNRQPEVEAAMMSGSGSTVFAILKKEGSVLEKRLKDFFGETFWTCLCRTTGD